MSSATIEWVIGTSGRPIRVGGKAHKKMLKQARVAEDTAAAAARPTTSAAGTGRIVPSEPEPVTMKKPVLKRADTMVNGVEPAIKKKKVSKRKTVKIMEEPMHDEDKEEEGSLNAMEDEESESSEEGQADGEEEEEDSSKAAVGVIVDKFLAKHEKDLVRAYEFYGDGEKFVAHLNELMEKDLA